MQQGRGQRRDVSRGGESASTCCLVRPSCGTAAAAAAPCSVSSHLSSPPPCPLAATALCSARACPIELRVRSSAEMSSVDGKRRRPRRRSLQPDSAAGPIAPSPSPASHLGKRRRRVSDSSAPSQPPPLPAASAARVEEKDEEERELEAFLFAGSIGTASLPFGHEMKMGEEAQDKAESSALPAPLEQSSEDEEQTGVSALFVIDKRGSSRVAAADSAALPAAPAAADDADAASSASSAVWYDPDDLSHRIDVSAQSRLRKLRHSASERLITAADFQRRLRSVYSNLQHPASWTQGKGAVAEQHEPGWDAFVSSRGVRRRTAPSLPSGHLDIQPLRDANSTQPAEVRQTAERQQSSAAARHGCDDETNHDQLSFCGRLA